MKKISKKSSFVFMFISLIMVSCKKEINNLISEEKSLTDSCVRANFAALDIGEIHNQTVIELYKCVNFTNPKEAMNMLITNFYNLEYDPTSIGISRSEFNEKTLEMYVNLKANNYDLRNWNSTSLRQLAIYSYFEDILRAIDDMKSLPNLLDDLDNIENNAQKHLNCNNLDIIIGVIKITKASAYLWSPKSDGGYGLTPGLNDEQQNKELPSWLKRAIQSDATASMTYMMGIGIGGAITTTLIPPTGAAFLLGWGITAGLGSAAGAAKL